METKETNFFPSLLPSNPSQLAKKNSLENSATDFLMRENIDFWLLRNGMAY
jgi:hypothetical protein